MALTKTQVSQLYVSTFGRASEGAGNTFWQTDQADMVTTANVMLNTDAAKEYFGTTLDNDQAFIEHIYLNTLGKTVADDPTGIAFWVGELATKSKGEVITALINAATATENAGNAQDQFNNKVAVSDFTADSIEVFTDTATFTAYVSGVTHETSTVDTAKAAVTADIPPVAGETFTLTTGVDSILGTAGDDTFTANAGTNSINGTLQDTFQSVDTIGAGEGTDTLNAQLGSNGAATFAGTIADVENVNLTVFTGSTFNMANVSGAKTVTSNGSVGALAITNVGNVIDLGISNSKANVTMTYLDAAVQGTTDSMALNLSGANGTTAAQTVTVNNTAAGTIETLTVNSTGSASSIAVAGTAFNATTTLNVTGDQNVTMTTAGMAALTSVDASAATGNVSVNITPATGNVVAKGGAGDDTFTLAALTSSDSFDGGAGTDTFASALTGTVTGVVALANVETVKLSTNATASMSMAGAASLSTIKIGGTNDANVITLNSIAATAATVEFNGAGTTTAQNINGLNYNLATSSATTDALAISVGNTTAAGIATDKAKNAVTTIASITANGVENITLSTANLGADDTTVAGVSGGLAVTALTANTLQNLTVTSDTLVNIGTVTATTVNTIDASAAAGGMTVNYAAATNSAVTGSTAVTYTGGAGVDTITAATAGTNSISTGAGNDVVTMGISTLKNTIDLGAGNDSIQLAGATASIFDTITTGTGVDTIKFDHADALANTPAIAKVVVTDFTVGSGGDKLDLDSNIASNNATILVNFQQVAAGAATTAGSGMVAIADNIDMSAVTNQATLNAAVTAVLTTTTANTLTDFNNAASELYIAIDDGADTYVLLLESNGTDTAFDATTAQDNATLMVKLTGVTDVTKLTTDNFVDFL